MVPEYMRLATDVLICDPALPHRPREAFEHIATMRPGDMEVPKMLARLYHHLEQPGQGHGPCWSATFASTPWPPT